MWSPAALGADADCSHASIVYLSHLQIAYTATTVFPGGCRASLSRKAAWYPTRAQLLPMFTITIARSTLLMYAADWTVHTTWAAVEAYKSTASRVDKLRQWLQKVLRHSARTLLSWTLSAVGAAAIAAFLAPRHRVGQVAVVSHFLLDAAISNLVYMSLEGGLWDPRPHHHHQHGGPPGHDSCTEDATAHIDTEGMMMQ